MRDLSKPIGVSAFQLTQALPESLKGSLPSIEDLEAELAGGIDEDHPMPTLDWLTRREDEQTAGRVPYRLLEPVAELSAGDPAAENMLIHGDNLDALKALLPFYAGRVKCIYIDPPYNTRSAFAHYDDNLEHSQWLAMIYPRLELLRDLLAEDGSIWVRSTTTRGIISRW